MKWLDSLTTRRLRIGIIGLPLLLTSIYYIFFAADRYVSEAVITVRSHQEQASLPGAALLLAGITPAARDDTLFVKEYIHSLNLLKRLDASLDVRKHFESEKIDIFFKAWSSFKQEWFLDYFRNRVEVLLDDTSGLLTIRAQGFSPKFAHDLGKAILEESDRIVNDFSQGMAREQISFSDGELQKATERVLNARGKVLAFQTRNKLLDPVAQAQATGALTSDLQAGLSKLEAELKSITGYLSEDSFQVKTARNQIAAIKSQIDAERIRSTSGSSPEQLNALANEFQLLTAQAGFAEDAYKLALASSENVRIEATRKVKSIVVVEPPTMPESALYPQRLYNLLTLLVASSMIYGIIRLIVATIREHQD